MYVRKTYDEFVIQQWTGALYGWEDVSAHKTSKEARDELKLYRQEQPEYPARMIKRRIKKEVGSS